MLAKLRLGVPHLHIKDGAIVAVFHVNLSCQTARLDLGRPLNRTEKLENLTSSLRRRKKSESCKYHRTFYVHEVGQSIVSMEVIDVNIWKIVT
jgi:hypothetical protein